MIQKARRQATSALRLLVSIRFQELFHSPTWSSFHLSLTGTVFTIGHKRVFSLGGWSPQIPTGFHVPRGTREHYPGSQFHFAYRTITCCGRTFQNVSAMKKIFYFPASLHTRPTMSRNPVCTTHAGLHTNGLGCSLFARHY